MGVTNFCDKVCHTGVKMQNERKVEAALTRYIKKQKGMALKQTGIAGIPDRLVLLPGGRIFFVELKSKGQKMRPLQEYRKRQLEELGFEVLTIDDTTQISEICR